MKTRAIAGIGVLALLLALSSVLGGRPNAAASDSEYEGFIELTTAPSGFLTYVSIADKSGTLMAGFALQSEAGAADKVSLKTRGRVLVSHTGIVIVTSTQRLAFGFPAAAGRTADADPIRTVIGIGSYDWRGSDARERPASHADFELAVGSLDGPPVCDYAECICGGAGTQSCNCEGRSVSCYSPYEACCKTNTAICCKPAASDARERTPAEVR